MKNRDHEHNNRSWIDPIKNIITLTNIDEMILFLMYRSCLVGVDWPTIGYKISPDYYNYNLYNLFGSLLGINPKTYLKVAKYARKSAKNRNGPSDNRPPDSRPCNLVGYCRQSLYWKPSALIYKNKIIMYKLEIITHHCYLKKEWNTYGTFFLILCSDFWV